MMSYHYALQQQAWLKAKVTLLLAPWWRQGASKQKGAVKINIPPQAEAPVMG